MLGCSLIVWMLMVLGALISRKSYRSLFLSFYKKKRSTVMVTWYSKYARALTYGID
jgi:hypothetical protein